MFKIDDIIAQVLKNCDIADSQHAGLYSICGLALRLRDLYKWENGLDPWIEKDVCIHGVCSPVNTYFIRLLKTW